MKNQRKDRNSTRKSTMIDELVRMRKRIDKIPESNTKRSQKEKKY